MTPLPSKCAHAAARENKNRASGFDGHDPDIARAWPDNSTPSILSWATQR